MSFNKLKVTVSKGKPLLINGNCCKFHLIWLTVCCFIISCLNCDPVNGQSIAINTTYSPGNEQDSETLSPPLSSLNVTCENGLETWNLCYNEAINYWSSVNDVDKRDCCISWHLLDCWSYKVKTVCDDSDLTLLEQSRINLSNQSRCMKYYDLSVCLAKPLPIWANILILSFGATLITGAAIFVYWRWIRLI